MTKENLRQRAGTLRRVETTPGDLLRDLDPEQRAAVASDARSICVLAGAGSGKTRVLTRRVARRIVDGSADAAHTLVITFTRKAADELRERLARSGVDDGIVTGTFHSVAYGQLRRRWIEQGRAVPAIATSPINIIESVLQTMRLGRSMSARVIAPEIAWAKSNGVSAADYGAFIQQTQRRPRVAAHQVARVYAAYESEKRKRRVIDYDDLLLLATTALTEDRTFAAAQRWLFRHIYVDELQDLNSAQFALLRGWLGDNDDLFVVGDPNQAIYGWNGADASFLREIERHFPGIEVHALRTNYRCSGEILEAAGKILPAALQSSSNSGDDGWREIGVMPRVLECADEHDEARTIARLVRDAHGRGHRWIDIAVLVRTNAQRGPIEAAFDELGIPCRTASGAAWLYGSGMRSALDHLREAPRRPLAQRLPDLEEMAEELAEKQRADVIELVAAARQCLSGDPEMLIADFLSWIEVASRHDAPSIDAARGDGSLIVTTFHRAKGLEWPVVVLAGVEEGLVPYGDPSGAQLAEERRLLYVAVTRARSELLCTWARRRTNARGELHTRRPSPWLAGIENLADTDRMSSSDVVETSISDARQKLDVSDDVNSLRVALIRWRAARAKLTGIEARLILSDSIVEEIVARRPRDRGALAEIPGFGVVRATSIGDELLRAIEDGEASGDRAALT